MLKFIPFESDEFDFGSMLVVSLINKMPFEHLTTSYPLVILKSGLITYCELSDKIFDDDALTLDVGLLFCWVEVFDDEVGVEN